MTIEQEQVRSKLAQARAESIQVSDLDQDCSSGATRRDGEVGQANGEENVAHAKFAVGTAVNVLSTLKLTAVPGAGGRPKIAIAIDPHKLPEAFKRQDKLCSSHSTKVHKAHEERAAAEKRLCAKLREVESALTFREQLASSCKANDIKTSPQDTKKDATELS